MSNRTPTTPRARARSIVLPVALVVWATGCSVVGGTEATAPDPTRSVPTASTTPRSTPRSTSGPSSVPSPSTRSSTSPHPRDTVGRATPSQLAGLVRIVASIGSGDRGKTSTGMVLASDGLVVTNNHGVAGATGVRATVMSSGRSYTARLVSADETRDVALLRLDGASGMDAVTLARRDAAVGDPVTVVGDAQGLKSKFTAATGTVIALDQRLVTPCTPTSKGERLAGLMLSTCNVVWGESGGPTYDARGHVVGMTTASVRTGRGLDGLSITTTDVRAIVRRLEGRAAR